MRIFESDFMEALSHVHPVTPLLIYMPVISLMIYLSVGPRRVPPIQTAAMFTLGVVVWTFVEYAMHRYAFHYEPRSHWGKRLHFLLHGVHHDYPNDATRLVMPPAVSLPLAVVFYCAFALLFGRFAPAAFAGLVFGYLCYDMIHYATHHRPMKRGIGAWLKRHHLRHHFRDEHVGYGVSSPLWDHIFGTRQNVERRGSDATAS